MIDPFAGYTRTLNDAALSNALPVTPSDTEDLPVLGTLLYAKNGGIMRVTLLNDVTVDLTVPDLEGWGLRIKRLHATGTTASDFILFW